MPMEDHRLKAFCLVVEMGSFSKAAEAKLMTQSAMSHLIKHLEDELGVRLLIREGKRIVLTPAGKVFYGHSLKILQQYEKMNNDINTLIGHIKGPLQIGSSATAAIYLLPQVLYGFSKAYPEVQIQVSTSNTEGIIDDLQNGRIDLGIVEGKVRFRNVVAAEIAEDEIVIIASEDNPLTVKKPLLAPDLASQYFIMPEIGSGLREFIEDFLNASKIETKDIRVLMTLANPELITQMVQSGLGISFVSKWSAFRAIQEGTVKILKLPGKSLYRKFYLVSHSKDPSTIVVRTFCKFVGEFRFFIPF
jgi:LysR family transcriptional regulator, transcriptional activator of the cysJI operon